MTVSSIRISTAKGAAGVDIVKPEGVGPFPLLVFCTDAGGRRASAIEMAERMASWGYLVAMPDLFFISGSPMDLVPGEGKTFARFGALWNDEELKAKFFRDYYGVATSPATLEVLFGALFAALEQRADVKPGKVGITGYCMGGNVALRVAGLFPEKVGAVASFHGGGLVTDAPDSPHLGIAKMKAEVYVAGAASDPSFGDAAKATLIATLEAAKLPHLVETYEGARHGFAVSDHTGSFDEAHAARHYVELEKLLKRALG